MLCTILVGLECVAAMFDKCVLQCGQLVIQLPIAYTLSESRDGGYGVGLQQDTQVLVVGTRGVHVAWVGVEAELGGGHDEYGAVDLDIRIVNV